MSSQPSAGGGPHARFPAGLRVLVVDDDATCLRIVEHMLKRCDYCVTTCSRAVEALRILRENKRGFDIVLSDVYMPDMDGFKLLEHIGLEMDLPVIMMSADDGKDVVLKGVTHGAVDYLLKPVSMEALKNIWQHVIRKRRNESKELENSGSLDDSDKQKKYSDNGDSGSLGIEENWKVVKRKKEGEEEDEFEEREDASSLKKQRVVWSVDLHQQFVAAVNQLGLEKAVPKKILELMNNPALTRENVASHLQKYRLYLKRVSGPQHQGRADSAFSSASDSSFSSVPSLDVVDLQALAASGQLTPLAIMALNSGPRSFFNSNAPFVNSSKMQPAMMHRVNNNQMGLLYGPSASMDSRQMVQAQQIYRAYQNTGHQVSEGAQGLLKLPSPERTSSSFSSGLISAGSSNSFVAQMNPQRQQISLPQHQEQMQIGVQQPSRGQFLNRVVVEHDSKISSTLGQQMVSNGVSNNFLVRSGAIINGRPPLQVNYMNMPPYAVPRALYSNVQNPHVSGTVNSSVIANTFTGMKQEAITIAQRGVEQIDSINSLKEVKDIVPNYDMFSDFNQSKNQEWKLQNLNLSYESSKQVGTQLSSIDYGFSISAQRDGNGIMKEGVPRNTCAMTKEVYSMTQTAIEHEKVEFVPQESLFAAADDNYDLESIFGRQPDTNGHVEFNF
ncbi:uncharacterized protein A4U43_C07F13600 [Asparagus officinalis]|uniref:Two-component response regulator n=1 Tax=Asparagus officinalis TaxID=4686 RepID=A0A5P1EBP9_ASPOF|nr:two-component response regulator ARR1-like [Asparagus officinalis]ONK63305.1 uncharacterized protein A4U43_C07F13600 [Asparagus officinalis]